jgi:peptidoglycan/LPS O-acetylase OafA/YrhL
VSTSPVPAGVLTTRRVLTNRPALDGVRGMAILIVVYFHSSLLAPSLPLRRFAKSGGLGVDAFFVLSGFLITALLLREQAVSGHVQLGNFYRRRALRLLPALVVFLAAHVIYALVTDVPVAVERGSVFSVLFYYSNTWLHRPPTSQGLGGLWSLAVEEQFYMVWPLMFLLLLGIRRRLTTVVFITVGLIAAVCVHRAMLFQRGTPTLTLYTRTATRADALLVGALLAQLWVRGKVPKRGLTLVAWPALAFYLFAVSHGVSRTFLYRGGYTLIAVAVGVVLLAVLESQWSVNDFLRLRPLRALGRVSYALYIWHLLIFAAVARIGDDWAPATRLVTGLVLCALVCSLSWTLVERPFLRWKVRLESRERLPTPVAGAHSAAGTGHTIDRARARGSERVVPVTGLVVVLVALAVGAAGLLGSGQRAPSPAKKTPSTFALTNEIVAVPDVEGKNAFEAIRAVREVHLNFSLTSRKSQAAGGDVISQDPAAGTEVRAGTSVHLIISK